MLDTLTHTHTIIIISRLSTHFIRLSVNLHVQCFRTYWKMVTNILENVDSKHFLNKNKNMLGNIFLQNCTKQVATQGERDIYTYIHIYYYYTTTSTHTHTLTCAHTHMHTHAHTQLLRAGDDHLNATESLSSIYRERQPSNRNLSNVD